MAMRRITSKKPNMTGTPHNEAIRSMAVGHLLLKSFWANEAVFQMMMLAYNLFLLFKFDSLHISEYRQ
jgi:hypothetical protein